MRLGAVGAVLASAVLFIGAAGAAPAQARALAPQAPVITEPDAEGKLVSGADVHMETRPMQNNDAGDTHLCTDWEIWTENPSSGERVWFAGCVSGVGRVHVHLGDGVFEHSFADRRDLAPDRTYTLRVRHRDTAGAWGPYATRRFRTDVEKKPLPGAPDWKVSQPGYVVEEVGDDMKLPVNIAMVPGWNGDPTKPLFYVTELYGRIKVFTGDFKKSTYADDLLDFDPSAQFPGTGEMGLTGIVVDPKSGDVFASMITKDDGDLLPKIVRFHSTDGGLTAATKTTVIKMDDEEQSASHQISNLTIGPDGKLYVHLGDGFDASTAKDLDSFRGKVLRMNLDGTAPADNPFYDAKKPDKARSYVWAYGFRNPFGGAWRATDGQHYEVENGPSSNDRFARVTKGADYHWSGGSSGLTKNALYNWKTTQGPVNVAFTEPDVFHAAGFPQDKYGHAFVTLSGPTWASGPQSRGKRIVEFEFDKDGSVEDPKTLIQYTGSGKTSVAGLAPGPDGLYFTGLYPKSGDATDSGAKIYRVRYVQKASSAPVTVYSDSAFRGDSAKLGTGITDGTGTGFGGVKDDSVSSLKVAGGYRAVVCAGGTAAPTGLGTCRYFGPGEHPALDVLNDQASLIAVFSNPEAGRGVVGYRDADLGDVAQTLGTGMYESVAGELDGGDSAPINALKANPGYRAIACDKDRTGGAALGTCRIFDSGTYKDLGDLAGKISLVGVVGPPVTAFAQAGAKGDEQSFEPGVYEGSRGELKGVGDNAVTTLRVEPGFHAVACANDGSTGAGTATLGRCRSFPAGEHNLAGTDLDDAVSLLAVYAGPGTGEGAKAYQDRDLQGSSSTYGSGLYEAALDQLGKVGNDKATSLRVTPGWRAVGCEQSSGKNTVVDLGLCRYFGPGDYPFVGADLNDKISMLAVGPRPQVAAKG
ncbi:sorbosone dehydrogenase family protein [Catellatospora sp. TT07R-123]|uniref:PQQ-dependent sugar dehydrogenase n=1 Tax=Catellatospora sp. TT07R-123 TaxID=2733863 RepID=UPI001BB39C52|nr:PQQ-dependent sugar dehydrogenase [Catellatospora sp. TT07R-123]